MYKTRIEHSIFQLTFDLERIFMNAKMIQGRERYLERIKSGEIVKPKRPSMKKAVLAKCKDCMGNYVDGRLDCGIDDCSLYHWMPYGKLRKKRNEKFEISC